MSIAGTATLPEKKITKNLPQPIFCYIMDKRDSTFGEVAEWLKAQHWKCCLAQVNEGSNPSLSVIFCLYLITI